MIIHYKDLIAYHNRNIDYDSWQSIYINGKNCYTIINMTTNENRICHFVTRISTFLTVLIIGLIA